MSMLEHYEQRVLIGMLSNTDHRYNWANKLKAEDFTTIPHKRVFELINSNKNMRELDLIHLIEIESKQGSFDISKLLESYEFDNFEISNNDYIDEIYRYKHYRELKSRFDNINPSDPQKKEIQALYENLEKYSEPTEDIGDGQDAFIGVHHRIMNKEKEKRKKETGFVPYDKALGGGISKGLHIIGARPAGGKTTYALEVMLAQAERYPNKLSVFFSCEVGAEDLWYKIVSNRTRVPMEKLETGLMNPTEEQSYVSACQETIASDQYTNFVYVASPKMNTLKAEQIIKKLEKKYNKQVGLVGFDYLQIMQPIDNKYFGDTEKVQKTSSDMRVFATKYPTIALVQVNRDGDSEECPETKHIKSSSQIEQDATTVLFLWWNNKEKCEMCSGLKKNKYGRSEVFEQLILKGDTGRISFGQHTEKENKKGQRTYTK